MRRRIECSNAEWQARLALAACYRVFDHLGWSGSIYNFAAWSAASTGAGGINA